MLSADMPLDPPATPLVAHDPYFSIWSFGRSPAGDETRHWTGTAMPLRCVARIDGETFRLLGAVPAEAEEGAFRTKQVEATRTVFHYEEAGWELLMEFLNPATPDQAARLARPVTIVSWEVRATDGKVHEVEIYFEVGAQAAVDRTNQAVEGRRAETPSLEVVQAGTVDQAILGKVGDDVRIDWGYVTLGVPKGAGKALLGQGQEMLPRWAAGESNWEQAGSWSGAEARVVDARPVLAAVFPQARAGAEGWRASVALAYDDVASVEYFGERLQGYWTVEEPVFLRMLEDTWTTRKEWRRRCVAFDEDLRRRAQAVGGRHYADLCAMATRQCQAAHKIVADRGGRPLAFSKENFSNGCMGTVDVFYPAAPQFLLLNPELIRMQMVPVLEYAQSGRWPWPYAPHDLGRYPKANGQVYGGGEKSEDRQMPVEECGNMLNLAAALCVLEGKADWTDPYWQTLTGWAQYLRERGFDPENQLCTDDFAGHLAHNTNLSLKSIMALAGYGRMCALRGEEAKAKEYRGLAQGMMGQWREAALDAAGHYRLAFDQPGTWSIKYNLVWDELLGLELGTKDIVRREVEKYRLEQNRYGLPLDNRSSYTKLDWIVWMAGVTETRADFDLLMEPIYRFVQASPERIPLTDWYWTQTGEVRGFRARSVIGGVFLPLLQAERGGGRP